MKPNFHHSYSDIGLLIGLISISIVGIVQFIRHRKKFNSYKQAFNLISLGIILLIVAVVAKCLISERWDKELIIAFLSFIQVGNEFITQGIALLGYMLLIFGVTILIIVKGNKSKY